VAKLASLAAAGVLFASSAIAGCGDDAGGSGDGVRETVDPLPELPRPWSPEVSREGGFAIGVPPRWNARRRGTRLELRSPDRLVAVSLASNRNEEIQSVRLRKVARATLRAGLPGVRKLEARDPRGFRHRYEAVSLSATGLAGRDPPVRERLTLVVIRRQELATYTALVAENAVARGRPHREEVERILRTLRGRPIGARPRAGLPTDQRSGRSG
jgi:hypothetical protein